MKPSNGRSDEIFLKWSLWTACSLGATTNSMLMCKTVDACKMGLTVKMSGVQRHKTVRDHMARMCEMPFTQLKTWPTERDTNTWAPRPMCRHVTSMDLGDQCRPMATKMVLHMPERATEHNGAIIWPLRHNFSKVVLADRLPAQMGHLQDTRLVRPR